MRPTKLKKRANETRQEKPKKLNPNLLKPQNGQKKKLIWQRFYSADNALCCDFTMHTLLTLIYRKDISSYWYYVVYTYLHIWHELHYRQSRPPTPTQTQTPTLSFLSFLLGFFGNIFFLSSLFGFLFSSSGFILFFYLGLRLLHKRRNSYCSACSLEHVIYWRWRLVVAAAASLRKT